MFIKQKLRLEGPVARIVAVESVKEARAARARARARGNESRRHEEWTVTNYRFKQLSAERGRV